MRILRLTVGRNAKGWKDFRWKYTGTRGFVVAYGPCNWRSLWRAIKWFFKYRRRRDGCSVVISSKARAPGVYP